MQKAKISEFNQDQKEKKSLPEQNDVKETHISGQKLTMKFVEQALTRREWRVILNTAVLPNVEFTLLITLSDLFRMH